MWELYTFWAFVPLLLAIHAQLHSEVSVYGPSWVFGLIAAVAPAYVAGSLAQRVGSLRPSWVALAVSGALLSLLLLTLPRPAFMVAMPGMGPGRGGRFAAVFGAGGTAGPGRRRA